MHCLFLQPTLFAPVAGDLNDLRTWAFVSCWEGAPKASLVHRDEMGQTWGIMSPGATTSMTPTSLSASTPSLASTGSTASWRTTHSYPQNMGRILSRRPWCRSDKEAIPEILTEGAKHDLDAPVSLYYGGYPHNPSQPRTLRGVYAWEEWRRIQEPAVRAVLADVVSGHITKGCYPFELTCSAI